MSKEIIVGVVMYVVIMLMYWYYFGSAVQRYIDDYLKAKLEEINPVTIQMLAFCTAVVAVLFPLAWLIAIIMFAYIHVVLPYTYTCVDLAKEFIKKRAIRKSDKNGTA